MNSTSRHTPEKQGKKANVSGSPNDSRRSAARMSEAELDLLLDAITSSRSARKVPAALKTLPLAARSLLATTLDDMLEKRRLTRNKRFAWNSLQDLLAPIPTASAAAETKAAAPQAVINGFAASAAAGDIEKVRRYLETFDPVALCTGVAESAIWLHDDSRAGVPLEPQHPKTALCAAVRSGKAEVVKLLLPHSDPMQEFESDLFTNTKVCALHDAIYLTWLAARGFAVWSSDALGMDARVAMSREAEVICESLLRRAEAFPTTPDRREWWRQALLASAMWDRPVVAEIALHHADTSARHDHRHAGPLNALEIAAHDNHADVVSVLCLAPGIRGRSRALDVALSHRSWEAAQALVEDAVDKAMGPGASGSVRRIRLYRDLVQTALDEATTREQATELQSLLAQLNAAFDHRALAGVVNTKRSSKTRLAACRAKRV